MSNVNVDRAGIRNGECLSLVPGVIDGLQENGD